MRSHLLEKGAGMSVMNTQRQEWKDFLDAIADFDDIPVILEDKGDIENEVLRRLGALEGNEAGTKCGIVILLGTVNAIPDGNAEFGPVLTMKHIARVIENVPINRDAAANGTLLTYSDVIEKLVGYSHLFKPATAQSPFIIEAPGIQEIDERFLPHIPIGPGKDAFFNCTGLFATVLAQCAAPMFEVDLDPESLTYRQVTLACATPGAAIFYTANGGKPNPAKTLYTAPFTPAANTTVKARAWLAGKLASEISTATIN
ncbi:MAG: chitobiase/beta-hexosaminidase C-terminal domain-containing protein [Verrucomicrobia bacterium]|nr:chitobiase/beta-hexosaminidase C-terminal domain-containing protein [Verrucomicrobiota bacterium]